MQIKKNIDLLNYYCCVGGKMRKAEILYNLYGGLTCVVNQVVSYPN